MKLIITEKPKVAQKMAEALADSKVIRQKGKGQASYFEFTKNGEQIFVAPAVGHLYTLEEKQKTNTYPTFEIEWRPSYEVSKGSEYTKGYVKTIEMLAKKADEIIVACDFDIEGSLIGYNALRYAGKRDVGSRMKFSALTKKDLQEAYMDRKDIDLENALAGESRHMLDWYYGINLSRALMSAIKSTGRFQVMSIGRVQGPALKFLADKEKLIKAFIPTPYWEITAEIQKIIFKHEIPKFTDKEKAQKAFDSSKIPPAKIVSITKKPFKTEPNPPFDLTSLQLEAYKQFKIQPKETQAIAQTLYENSMISYPRTSSQRLPAKLGLDRIISLLKTQQEYSVLAQILIDNRWFKPKEGKKDDPAHPAIHPTGQKGDVGTRERKVYDLIVKRFFSCFAQPAKRESQKVVALLNDQKFIITGSRTVEKGWFEFYAPYVKLNEITLPDFKQDQEVEAKNHKMEEKMTQPPKRFTPASIISELESRNLGTKATRATVIDTLFKRGYLKGDKSIEVTEFGIQVSDTVNKYAPDILDEEFTRSIEKDMEMIQKDTSYSKKVVDDGKKVLIKTLDNFKRSESDVGSDLSGALYGAQEAAKVLGKCPKCGDGDIKKLISRNKKQFAGCSNYPDCDNTYPLPQMGLIEATAKTCEHENAPIVKVIRKGKRPFEMCVAVGCPSKADWGKYKKKYPAKKKTTARKKTSTKKGSTTRKKTTSKKK